MVNSGHVRGGVDGVFGSMETVSNIGTIIGDNTGLQLSAGSSVTNSGTIAGATGVWLSGGSKLTNSGSIIGPPAQRVLPFNSEAVPSWWWTQSQNSSDESLDPARS